MRKYDLNRMLLEIEEDEALDKAPQDKRLSQAEIRKLVLERRGETKEKAAEKTVEAKELP